MASTSRAFRALRTSTARAAIPRQAPRCIVRSAARRGYASGPHSAAENTSDMPWLIGSVVFTVPALAYLLSGPSKPKGAHHGGSTTPSGAPIPPDDEAPAVESSGSSSSSDSSSKKSTNAGKDEKGEGGTIQFKSEEQKQKDQAKGGKEQSEHTVESGRDAAPPSADNASLAEKWDEKKETQEEYTKKARAGETKVLTSASDAPTKKTQTEDPREDPKKGEGEGAQKGGPSQ